MIHAGTIKHRFAYDLTGRWSVLNELHQLVTIDDLTRCGCDVPSDLEFLRPPRFQNCNLQHIFEEISHATYDIPTTFLNCYAP